MMKLAKTIPVVAAIDGRSWPQPGMIGRSSDSALAPHLSVSTLESDSKMICVFSGSGEALADQADVGDEDPSLGAGDGSLEVFG